MKYLMIMGETVMSEFLKGKRILLLYGRFFHYDQIVKEQLEAFGAIVDLFDARAEINVIEKAYKKINQKYYQKKQIRFHKDIQEKNKNIEYDFVFSNCYLPKDTIMGYHTVFPKSKFILYLDDSVSNTKGVESTFELFDRVVTFDRKDAETFNIGFRPLFFSDIYRRNKNRFKDKVYDICFIGTCHSDRLKIIENIEGICKKTNRTMYHFCYIQSSFMYLYYYVKQSEYRCKKYDYFSTKQMSAEKVAEIMAQSKIVLDIQHPDQTGLTMRTIETLGLGRKLITTNEDIVNYDFYSSNNIAVIDRNNLVLDETFFSDDYEDIPEEIYHKYSISGWIEELFI